MIMSLIYQGGDYDVDHWRRWSFDPWQYCPSRVPVPVWRLSRVSNHLPDVVLTGLPSNHAVWHLVGDRSHSSTRDIPIDFRSDRRPIHESLCVPGIDLCQEGGRPRRSCLGPVCKVRGLTVRTLLGHWFTVVSRQGQTVTRVR